MAKKAAGRSKPAKAKAKSQPRSKAKGGKPVKKTAARAKPVAKKAASRPAAKMKALVKSKAKSAGKKMATAARKVAKAAVKPGAARKAGESVRRKAIEVGQAVTDRTNSIADSITSGVAMATGVVIGTVEAILPPRESIDVASQAPSTPEHAGHELRDQGGETDEEDDDLEDDDLAEIE